ncbi:hypothetical protein H0H81_007382 [Sphagnurus paluster]|uniref:Aminoglycoside phosphotransferase domain-containing protein n=1 Tax=Sphagnurus paluster TaxID=117069 RepID=A0A9P7KLP7_9AGAR|nr:hypothetical protein H0H81_007382 [Sphagnurus paluster]
MLGADLWNRPLHPNSEHTVAKALPRLRGPGPPPEARALAFVYEHTSIALRSMAFSFRVPAHPRRVDPPRLRRAAAPRLRRISQAPRPEYEQPLTCNSPSVMIFSDHSYHLPTSDALIAFFNKKCHLPPDAPPGCRFIDDAPLVFTHNDLNPRNIILGDDGRLWMIDFEESGFYPP